MRAVIWHTNDYMEPVDRQFSYCVSYQEAIYQTQMLEDKWFLRKIYEYTQYQADFVILHEEMIIVMDPN